MHTLAVIVLNYNGADCLQACLRSIVAQRLPEDIRLRIIVVDNASTDGSIAIARTDVPAADIIINKRNVGFAAGNNIGIRYALERGVDAVCLVNNDAILSPTTLTTLFRVAEERRGIVCPVITTPQRTIWYAGARRHPYRMRITHRTRRIHPTRPYKTDSATGCVMCIHKDVFATIGLLNESFFLYYEDADFSACAHSHNIFVGVAPMARAQHGERSTRAEHRDTKTYWLTLSGALYFLHHARWYHKLWYKVFLPLRRFRARRRRNHAVLRALRDVRTARTHYVSHC